MKKIYKIFLFLCFCNQMHAQQDTVLFENFQWDVDYTQDWGIYPFGDDTTWVNIDADGLPPYTLAEEDKKWFWSEFFHFAEDTVSGVVNSCIGSLSYMDDFAPGNRNWLILPPISVSDNSYTLHWTSAPFQMPRYLDGYTVLVSTGSNDLFQNAFTDTLFRAAQMIDYTGDGQNIDVSNFNFSPGYIHANALQDTNYYVLWAPGDSTLCRGLLEPHSLNLSAYAGQKIYIAFVHDADDDYFLALDDILVTKAESSAANDLSKTDLRFVAYPNPVLNWLDVLYRLPETAAVRLRVSDINGKIVLEKNYENQASGEYQERLDARFLPAGIYSVSVETSGVIRSKVFVKR